MAAKLGICRGSFLARLIGLCCADQHRIIVLALGCAEGFQRVTLWAGAATCGHDYRQHVQYLVICLAASGSWKSELAPSDSHKKNLLCGTHETTVPTDGASCLNFFLSKKRRHHLSQIEGADAPLG
jgi:hypothetical protein